MNTEEYNRPRGKLIVLEGIDGCGKSTQVRALTGRLSALGVPFYETREPTDAPIGSLIHQIMTGRLRADNRVIAALFAADRIDHLTNETDGLLQKINSGVDVIASRYYFSSYAYHGVDLDMSWVIGANSVCAELLRPAATVFLDVPVQTALARISKGRFHTELFEKEERLTKVREQYFKAFDALRGEENIVIVDADADADTVSERVWDAVRGYFVTDGRA